MDSANGALSADVAEGYLGISQIYYKKYDVIMHLFTATSSFKLENDTIWHSHMVSITATV